MIMAEVQGGTPKDTSTFQTPACIMSANILQSKARDRDFPGGPVVKTSPSSAGGADSIPGRGAKIPHASWPKN